MAAPISSRQVGRAWQGLKPDLTNLIGRRVGGRYELIVQPNNDRAGRLSTVSYVGFSQDYAVILKPYPELAQFVRQILSAGSQLERCQSTTAVQNCVSDLDIQSEPRNKRALCGVDPIPGDVYLELDGDGGWHPLAPGERTRRLYRLIT